MDPFDLDVFMPYLLSNLESQLNRSSVRLYLHAGSYMYVHVHHYCVGDVGGFTVSQRLPAQASDNGQFWGWAGQACLAPLGSCCGQDPGAAHELKVDRWTQAAHSEF